MKTAWQPLLLFLSVRQESQRADFSCQAETLSRAFSSFNWAGVLGLDSGEKVKRKETMCAIATRTTGQRNGASFSLVVLGRQSLAFTADKVAGPPSSKSVSEIAQVSWRGSLQAPAEACLVLFFISHLCCSTTSKPTDPSGISPTSPRKRLCPKQQNNTTFPGFPFFTLGVRVGWTVVLMEKDCRFDPSVARLSCPSSASTLCSRFHVCIHQAKVS